jgi:ribonuclease HI
MKVTCYTDGACKANGRDGAVAGWAFVAIDENENILAEGSGRIEDGTNNKGEIQAIIEAMKATIKLTADKIEILSDSAYCINGITNWRYNWKRNDWWRDAAKKQELKNREMWKELDSLIDSSRMTFTKVAGHAGVKWNEYVDKAAVAQTR